MLGYWAGPGRPSAVTSAEGGGDPERRQLVGRPSWPSGRAACPLARAAFTWPGGVEIFSRVFLFTFTFFSASFHVIFE